MEPERRFDDHKAEHHDRSLVTQAQAGDREALEALVGRHQRWIYNIAIRMLAHPQDAEDATQEILIKAITRLSTFEGRSRFRTWLYRIVVNHVLNARRGRAEPVPITRPGASPRPTCQQAGPLPPLPPLTPPRASPASRSPLSSSDDHRPLALLPGPRDHPGRRRRRRRRGLRRLGSAGPAAAATGAAPAGPVTGATPAAPASGTAAGGGAGSRKSWR